MKKATIAVHKVGTALIGILTLSLLSVSCKDNVDRYESPSVVISPSLPEHTIHFDQTGGTMELAIQTNRKWTVQKDAEWIAVTPTSGDEGATTIVVKALPNDGLARQGGFRLIAGGKSFFYTVEQKSSEGKDFSYTPLAEIARMGENAGKDGVTINEDINIQAVVVSKSEGRNFLFSAFHYIVDKDNKGMVLTLPKGESPLKYGDQITANIKGCKLSNYNGTIQVECSASKMKVIPNQEIKPINATVAEIKAGKYAHVLVRINDVQFVKYENEKMYSGTFFMKSHALTDRKGESVDVEILQNAAFKDEAVPAGSGSITAIVAVYKKDAATPAKHSLKPSVYSDMTMSAARFVVEGSVDPNPRPTDTKPLATLIEEGRKLAAKEYKVIEENYTVEATVTANNNNKQFAGNSYYYIQDASGNAMTLRLGKDDPISFQVGQKLTISVKGGKLSNYFGSITFDLSLPQIKASEGTPIAPQAVSVKDLSASTQDQFVIIQNVQIKTIAPDGSTLANPAETNYTKWEMTDKQGNTFQVEIKKGCTFGSESVPSGSGSVSGIVTVFNNVYSIRPISLADLKLTGSRF